jgi:hypothetical protein
MRIDHPSGSDVSAEVHVQVMWRGPFAVVHFIPTQFSVIKLPPIAWSILWAAACSTDGTCREGDKAVTGGAELSKDQIKKGCTLANRALSPILGPGFFRRFRASYPIHPEVDDLPAIAGIKSMKVREYTVPPARRAQYVEWASNRFGLQPLLKGAQSA